MEIVGKQRTESSPSRGFYFLLNAVRGNIHILAVLPAALGFQGCSPHLPLQTERAGSVMPRRLHKPLHFRSHPAGWSSSAWPHTREPGEPLVVFGDKGLLHQLTVALVSLLRSKRPLGVTSLAVCCPLLDSDPGLFWSPTSYDSPSAGVLFHMIPLETHRGPDNL